MCIISIVALCVYVLGEAYIYGAQLHRTVLYIIINIKWFYPSKSIYNSLIFCNGNRIEEAIRMSIYRFSNYCIVLLCYLLY